MRTRRVALVCGIVAGLGLAAWAAIAFWPDRGFSIPWNDSFASGQTAGWQAFGGTWSLYENGIRNNSDERGAKFIAGSPRWADYAVDADIRLLGEDGDAGLIVRSSEEEEGVDSYSGYYIGLRDSNNSITIGRADHGWMEYQAVSPRHPLEPSRWYHLHVVAVGCDIAAVASAPGIEDSTWVAMREDSCARTGRIGLRSYSSGGVWKNIRVAIAHPADLQPLLAHVSPGPPPEYLQSEAGFNSLRLNQPGISPAFSEALRSAANTRLTAIAELRGLSPLHSPTATIRGSVTLTSPRVYVQDGTGGAEVEFPYAPSLKIGDEVQVTGSVEPSRFGVMIRNANVRLLWQRSPAPPVSVTATQAAAGQYDGRFVETEAEVDPSPPRSSLGTLLMLHSGHQRYPAILDARAGQSARHISAHSTVRVRGICVVDPAFTGNTAPFAILLRSADDVRILAGPPWWDLRNLLAAAIALPILAVLAFFIHARADRWRMRAVLDERLNMAREVHDTLAQGYAAIALQLESALDRNRRTLAPDAVALALQMAVRSRGEAHLSIASLRALHFDAPFPELLRQLLQHQVCPGIKLEVRSNGNERRLPIEIEANLLRIIQECVANTVRHAHASFIEVQLNYLVDCLEVMVTDDGSGFDPGQAPGTDQGHYGLTGMRERSARIRADLHVASDSSGTRVSARIPLPRPRFIAWEYILSLFNRTRHAVSNLNYMLTRRSERFHAKTNSRLNLG